MKEIERKEGRKGLTRTKEIKKERKKQTNKQTKTKEGKESERE